MIVPFKREQLRARNLIEDAQARTQAARQTPAERVERSLALSQMVRELARATGANELTNEHADLAEKSHLYAEPLRLLDRGK